MKKLIFCFAFLVFMMGSSLAQSGKDLDNERGTSMKPIVEDMNSVINALEQDSVEIVHIEFDLIFNDKPRQIFRNLYSGYNYGFFAYGDYRINQIGITLYKQVGDDWEYVKSGQIDNASKTTSLMIKIDETGQYKVELTANDMEEGYSAGHYALYILHD
jgi:hypothetical protein